MDPPFAIHKCWLYFLALAIIAKIIRYYSAPTSATKGRDNILLFWNHNIVIYVGNRNIIDIFASRKYFVVIWEYRNE